MTEKRTFILAHNLARRNAMHAVANAPDGWCVEVKPRRRSLSQNDRLHAICEAMAKSGFKWRGRERTKLEWKVLFISGHTVATGGVIELEEGLEGELINLRESSAEMSRARSSSLIEYAQAFVA